ncbi:Hcp family type VI secretion system effector [Arenibaculum pallidiluteum]|uniref:Hcp family type VI secretion system effector n=1 Tax=Arenibaculum pallidiluteum TaxID=2812559 RepID=UPI001A960068|nr:type VI secretion system tube protein Hcp [Arenibaculum pallidiluteum]
MAFDAYLLFTQPSGRIHPKGESKLKKDAITLADEWSFSLENKLNISSHTAGAGAGKAEFEAFTIKKQVDTASPDLFIACGSGAHFDKVELVLLKSSGDAGQGSQAQSNIFLTWTFSMLAVEKVEWSYGDPAPEETVTFRFGACKVNYKKQDAAGKLSDGGEGAWSQVQNSATDRVA